jgi:hypothetical protein
MYAPQNLLELFKLFNYLPPGLIIDSNPVDTACGACVWVAMGSCFASAYVFIRCGGDWDCCCVVVWVQAVMVQRLIVLRRAVF